MPRFLLLLAITLGVAATLYLLNRPPEEQLGEIVTISNGLGGSQKAVFFPSREKMPLVVDLHYWSGDYLTRSGTDQPIDGLIFQQGWNYIRPDLAGPNDRPEACCSDLVVASITAAIDYAQSAGRVDDQAIFIIGASGGGYTALCYFMKGDPRIDGYVVWAPIVDLVAWFKETEGTKYHTDIMRCTASEGVLDVAAARQRSPIDMPRPRYMPPLAILAGVRDGVDGSVPYSHAVRMFERLSELDMPIPVLQALACGQSTDDGLPLLGDRPVLHRSQRSTIELTIFDGTHEMLAQPTLEFLRQLATRGRL